MVKPLPSVGGAVGASGCAGLKGLLCAISSDAPIHALRLPSSLVSSVHPRPGQKVSALSNDGIAGTLVVVELTKEGSQQLVPANSAFSAHEVGKITVAQRA